MHGMCSGNVQKFKWNSIVHGMSGKQWCYLCRMYRVDRLYLQRRIHRAKRRAVLTMRCRNLQKRDRQCSVYTVSVQHCQFDFWQQFVDVVSVCYGL